MQQEQSESQREKNQSPVHTKIRLVKLEVSMLLDAAEEAASKLRVTL